jgi:hypothetical protein
MHASKLQLKLFADRGADLPVETFIPVFHRWIKHHVLPELVIDVANYAHVPDGPGVVLIGDANDYFLDLSLGGKLGLLGSRKRHAPAPADRLADLFRRTAHAALLLEREPALEGKLSFRTDEWLLRINDRLAAPSTPAGFAPVSQALQAFAAGAFPGASIDVSRTGEPRQLLTARITVKPAPTLAALLERLGGPIT